MKRNKFYIIFLIIILISIISILIFTKNKENKKINIEEIKKSIVYIEPENKLINYENNPEWILDKNIDFWIWTGFFADKNWIIITSNHIIQNNNTKIFVTTFDNKKYEAKIISRNEKNDLMKLKINTKEIYNPLIISKNKINIWDKIISFWINEKNFETTYVLWNITNKNITLDNISNLIEFSPEIKPGFSGWPIIDINWEVIWINNSIYNWKSYGKIEDM